MESDLIGQTIDGQFKVLAEVGRGSWGIVYKAHQLSPDRIVALKILNRDQLADENACERFLREALSLKALKHKNLVEFYSFGQWHKCPYYAMEYLNGKTLSAMLEDRGRLPVNEIASIGAQACDALSHVHSNNVIHRDISPSNILIMSNGAVKLLDFGLAKLLKSQRWKVKTLTQAGMTLGSAHYMSPEQCMGDKVDGRSDIYALGCVLYECAEGHPPFNGESRFSCMYSQINDKYPPLRDWQKNQDVRVLNHILEKTLSKQPEFRFRNAEDMATALQPLCRTGMRNTLVTFSKNFKRPRWVNNRQPTMLPISMNRFNRTFTQNIEIWVTIMVLAVISLLIWRSAILGKELLVPIHQAQMEELRAKSAATDVGH